MDTRKERDSEAQLLFHQDNEQNSNTFAPNQLNDDSKGKLTANFIEDNFDDAQNLQYFQQQNPAIQVAPTFISEKLSPESSLVFKQNLRASLNRQSDGSRQFAQQQNSIRLNDDKSRSEENIPSKGPLLRFEHLNENSYSFTEEERYIFRLVSQLNVAEIKEFLAQSSPLNLTKLVDSSGYTPLHLAVYKNSLKMTQLLCDYVMSNPLIPEVDQRSKILKKWVNKQTIGEEGFTALHFASFHGNLTLIRYLISKGSDIHATNRHKINMLHVAAQGDQPASLAFFKLKGINVNSRDAKQSSPLHWACYAGAESSVAYLLAWDSEVNAVDSNGLSPLHLAIKAAEDLKSSRSVRHLLIKGADRQIKDKMGRTPVDIVNEIRVPELQSELKTFLEEPHRCQCFMIKTPLKKINKNPQTVVLYIFLMFLSYALANLFIYSEINISNEYAYVTHGLFAFSTLFFLISWLRDPGYLKKDDNIEFFELIEKFDANHLCPECQVIRTERSRHCNICNRCVERFDHHCPWINNCVGSRNHGFFYLYIITTVFYIICVLYMSFKVIIQSFSINDLFDDGNHELATQGQAIQEAKLNSIMWFLQEYGFELLISAGIFIIMIGLFFFFPLILLVVVQSKNLLLNMTTSERFSRRRLQRESSNGTTQNNGNSPMMPGSNGYVSSESSWDKQQKKSCFSYFGNCYSMCCYMRIDEQQVLYDKRLKNLRIDEFNN